LPAIAGNYDILQLLLASGVLARLSPPGIFFRLTISFVNRIRSSYFGGNGEAEEETEAAYFSYGYGIFEGVYCKEDD